MVLQVPLFVPTMHHLSSTQDCIQYRHLLSRESKSIIYSIAQSFCLWTLFCNFNPSTFNKPDQPTTMKGLSVVFLCFLVSLAVNGGVADETTADDSCQEKLAELSSNDELKAAATAVSSENVGSFSTETSCEGEKCQVDISQSQSYMDFESTCKDRTLFVLL